MLAKHYPELFADDPNMAPRANAFAAKCHELVSFLVEVRGMTKVTAACAGRATYHDSCSGLRELGVKVTCLHEGTAIAEGTIDDVSSNERVIEVYLGR